MKCLLIKFADDSILGDKSISLGVEFLSKGTLIVWRNGPIGNLMKTNTKSWEKIIQCNSTACDATLWKRTW